MSTTHKITVSYSDLAKSHVSHNVAVDESYILEKIEECFKQTKISLEEVLVRFDFNPAHTQDQCICTISIVSPDIDFNTTITGKDFAFVTREAVDKTVHYIRDEKNKLTQ